MKQKTLGLFMVFVGMLLSASIVHAGQPTIAVTHSIVSAVPTPSGTDVTLNITITNNSTESFTNLSFVGTGAFEPADPVAGALNVTSLATGQSATFNWNVIVKQFGATGFMRLLGSAFDAAGNQVTIPITSIEAVQ